MNIFRKIQNWFTWIKTRRAILKAIKANFKYLYDNCVEWSLKYDSGNIPIKFYGKIIKQSRAKRNIITNNLAADLYDNALNIMYKTNAQLGNIHGEKYIKIKDIKTSCDTIYKQLKKSLKRNKK